MADTPDDATVSVSEMLEKLSIATDEERKELLEQARPHLLAPDAGFKFKQHLEQGNFSVIFQCLKTNDKTVVLATTEILSRIFEFIDPAIVMEKYSDFLLQGLEHDLPQVKEVMIGVINRCLSSTSDARNTILEKKTLLATAAKCLIDKELSVSKQAHKMLKTLAAIRNSQGQVHLFLEPFLSCSKEMLEVTDDALKLRVLELFVEVSNMSQEHLELATKERLLQSLFEDLKKDDDVLVQLNALEIISNLAESKQGFQYLSSLNILQNMDARLNQVASGSMAHFLMPGYIKFFGRIAHHSPSIFSSAYPNFSAILLTMLNSDDQDGQILALEVLGHIALTQEGKKMLLMQNSLRSQFFDVLRSKIKSGTSDAKARALSVFVDVVRNVELIEDMDEVHSRELFETLQGSETMTYITDLAKKPFPDISSGAFDILVAICVYPWAVQQMLNIGGFFEYLLDRSTAKDKEGKEHKYHLISAICCQREVNNLVPPEILKEFRLYVKQGPFYVEATVQVALDEM